VVLNRVLALVLGVSASSGALLTVPALAAGSAGPKGAVTARALTARLRVGDASPLQLHGVLFDASRSTGPIAVYTFKYGDGVVERSYQPLAMHGYRRPGTYHATVVVTSGSGATATSSPVRIRVRDGIPPVVSIDTPRAGQRMRVRSGGALFKGTVSDSGDVSHVQLAIQLVSSRQHFNTHGYCVWYDAHRYLVLSGCASPYFFNATVSHGHWRFRIDRQALIPAGTYVVRVRAIDHTGNISHYYSVALRTILPFQMVP
jgi:hypothetical protein